MKHQKKKNQPKKAKENNSKKNSFSFYLLAIIVLIIVILIIAVYQQSNKKENYQAISQQEASQNSIRQETEQEIKITQTSIERCEADFNKYAKISQEAYPQVKYLLILIKEIKNEEEARQFDASYSSIFSGRLLELDLTTFKQIEYNYPIIALLANMTIKNQDNKEASIPIILSCNAEGLITENSKNKFSIKN